MSNGYKITALAYADDIVIFANSIHDMQKILDFCTVYSSQNNFKFSPSKCEVMVFHKNYNSLGNLYLNGKVLQYVEQATYLGVSYHKSKLSFKIYLTKYSTKLYKEVQG